MPRTADKIGPYVLIRKIGRGGFGEVWLAEKRTALSITRFALKLPNDEDVKLDIIQAEANVWVNVSGHPNVLPIIEADIYDGQVVIASEFVEGGSLADWLRSNEGKAPSVPAAVNVMRGILDGLEFLHSKKVVHRDLKPENILMQEGIPRLTDFGISRMLRADNASTKNIVGTIAFMPPEAFAGKHSFQTDIWSVGVIFYEMLSGRLPFDREEHLAQMHAITSEEPEPLPDLIPDVWRNFITGALKKDRSLRFQTASEMKHRFDIASRPWSSDADLEERKTITEARTMVLPGQTIDGESDGITADHNSSTVRQGLDTGDGNQVTEILSDESVKNKDGSKWPRFKRLAFAFLILMASLAVGGIGLRMWNSQEYAGNKIAENVPSPPGSTRVKSYQEMSDNEKFAFVSAEADQILRLIQKGQESEISDKGRMLIKEFVDTFAKRRTIEPKDSCGSATWTQSDLATVLKRGAKIAAEITAGFKDKEIPPTIGIYMAMNESEFCPCMQAATGPLGIFQFTAASAKLYGLKAVAGSNSDNPDERCNPEPASRAAATYVAKLMAEDFGGGRNQTTFAIAAFNSGEGSLRSNINTAKETALNEPTSFWKLIESNEKMSQQFQQENSKYLPKFFAAAIIGENPKVFGVDIQPLSSYIK